VFDGIVTRLVFEAGQKFSISVFLLILYSTKSAKKLLNCRGLLWTQIDRCASSSMIIFDTTRLDSDRFVSNLSSTYAKKLSRTTGLLT
jgi:hypothetical protein